ncbi:MAG: GAF domain-containing protein [Chloroflexi bacterium CFX4]|nr:GAF domain-containing protein [Chloroflexi bacterium CFX4]MDL1923007.1 GAF domain-containing protein [Chloroflexi bacterium CFX3]
MSDLIENLAEQLEELKMLQHVDKELGATLDFDNVLMLTMDWALRRTGAAAGMFITVGEEESALRPLAALGYPYADVRDQVWTLERGIVGRAARTHQAQHVTDLAADPDHRAEYVLEETQSVVAMPIELRGKVIGVIWLEGEMPNTFSPTDVAFVQRLAQRAAIALDHARLYREAAHQADEMASLYTASRMISTSLEKAQVLAIAAQSLATTLRVSSVVMADYRSLHGELEFAHAYRLPTARHTTDTLPRIGSTFNLENLPEVRHAIETQRSAGYSAQSRLISDALRAFMTGHAVRAVLIIPLATAPTAAQSPMIEVVGVAFAMEGRHERRFTDDECGMAEALGSQIASALRQARLYAEVRELEEIKSHMIRMASHDLRNPLSVAINYFDMFVHSMPQESLTADQTKYIKNVQQATSAMRTLIEDLLTLEKVESEREALWNEIAFNGLVSAEVEAQGSAARLKKHTITAHISPTVLFVRGSAAQLRQAVGNLINNAIKYTPDGGFIQVRLTFKERRLIFEVQDNGYGISKERQDRLFSSFYRAREPGTDHITGTGLGLSLVRTVIERHGGRVWANSEPGIGSIFSFWLPLVRTAES